MRSVLIMKPGEAGALICAQLQSLGYPADKIHYWGAFEMKAPADTAAVRERLLQAASAGIPIVLVSPSAADVVAGYVKEWPSSTVFATVGSGTVKAIKKHWGDGFTFLCPPGEVKESGSEALFPILVDAGYTKKVVIARGQTGRAFLKDHLEEIGCEVEVLVVYIREPFKAEPQDKAWISLSDASPVVFLTSTDSVDILLTNCSSEEQGWMKKGIVLTIHPRIAAHLQECGFPEVRIISSADAVREILQAAT